MEVGQDTHGSCSTAGGDNSHTVGASKTLRAPRNCLDGSLAGRDWGWRSQPTGHHSWKPLKARAEVSPAPLSLPLPPSGSKALTHLHFCDLLDRKAQEKEKKKKKSKPGAIYASCQHSARGTAVLCSAFITIFPITQQTITIISIFKAPVPCGPMAYV